MIIHPESYQKLFQLYLAFHGRAQLELSSYIVNVGVNVHINVGVEATY